MQNKIVQPFLIVFLSFVLLLALSFLPSFAIFGYEVKPVALFSDLTTQPPQAIVVNDSSVIAIKDTIPHDPSDIIDYRNDSALMRFFLSLNKTKKSKHQTRIAYFGDSFIEGDLITQDFRALLQDEFGGGGVGYVPITSIVAGFRQSVVHSFDGWTTYSLVDDPPKGHDLFISGFTFCPALKDSADTTANTGNWVKYGAVHQPHLNSFASMRLFYGNSNGNNRTFINGNRYELNDSGIFNELRIDGPASGIIASFNCSSPIDIFGMSLESDTGVIVDNFSFRGNSGLPMCKVSRNMYKKSNEHLQYDLIIIEYGLNAISEKAKEYKWYERGYLATIKYLKSCYPNTDILIIGVGDKALRIDGKYQEDPAVQQILTLEQNVALEEKCAFWSLYDAMGGTGSMITWADATPPLANKDYTHLNFRGARKAGELLHEKLMKKYKMFNTPN